MTLKELSRYYKLRVRIEEDKAVLASLRRKAVPSTPSLSGMPHTPGVSDKVGDLAVEIADLEESIHYKEAMAEVEKRRLMELINTIDDSWMRTLFRLRFVRCLTWGEVAATVGGKNTEASVKTVCYRYLKSCSVVLRHVPCCSEENSI